MDVKYLEVGLIPPSLFDFDLTIKEKALDVALSQMTPEEALLCRRKFRKLWKKAKKQMPLNTKNKSVSNASHHRRLVGLMLNVTKLGADVR